MVLLVPGYVKLRRGVGIEFPDGSRMGPRSASEMWRAVCEGQHYVVYRQGRSLKGRVLEGRLDKAGVTRTSAQGDLTKRVSPCRLYYMGRAKPLTLTPTRLVILNALAEGHRYGLEIIRATRGKLASGQLYPELRRLAEAGYIKPRAESETTARAERGRIPRTYYTLTDPGRRALEGGLSYYWGLRREKVPATFELIRRFKEI